MRIWLLASAASLYEAAEVASPPTANGLMPMGGEVTGLVTGGESTDWALVNGRWDRWDLALETEELGGGTYLPPPDNGGLLEGGGNFGGRFESLLLLLLLLLGSSSVELEFLLRPLMAEWDRSSSVAILV